MLCPPTSFFLDSVIASAFLDRNGEYAKREEDLHTVRLFYEADASPGESMDITPAQFFGLSEEDQQRIRDAGTSVKVNL
jgi:hypothetical protein